METTKQPQTREDWFALIDEQAASGLTQTAFCKQHNLILCRFSYYKQLRTPPQPKGTFTPIKAIKDSALSSGSIQIDLPNGFSCHVPANLSDFFDEAGIELSGELKDQLDDSIDVESYQRKKHPVRMPIPSDLPRTPDESG